MDAAAGGLGRTTNGGDGSRADPARHGGPMLPHPSLWRNTGDGERKGDRTMENMAATATMTAMVTVLVTWQWLRAAARWQRGRGLLSAQERVERENRERLYHARADRAQGWRELWRAIAEFLLVLVVVVLVGFVLGGTVWWWR